MTLAELPHASVAVTVTVAEHVPEVEAVFVTGGEQLSVALTAAIAAVSAAARVG